MDYIPLTVLYSLLPVNRTTNPFHTVTIPLEPLVNYDRKDPPATNVPDTL